MGKNYLIVGASSGIGKEMMITLSKMDDVCVIGCARRIDKLNELKKTLPSQTIVLECDVCDNDSINQVFKYLNEKNIKLDGMIYCAGEWYVKPIKIMKPAEIDHMFKVNVFGFYEFCRLYQKKCNCNDHSAIIGISSYASVTCEAGTSAYAMSKAAMNTQVAVISKELIKRGITVNTIMPAIVKSRMGKDTNDWTDEQINDVSNRQPLGIITKGTVVNTILFLLSDDGAYITGQAIPINAGYIS